MAGKALFLLGKAEELYSQLERIEEIRPGTAKRLKEAVRSIGLFEAPRDGLWLVGRFYRFNGMFSLSLWFSFSIVVSIGFSCFKQGWFVSLVMLFHVGFPVARSRGPGGLKPAAAMAMPGAYHVLGVGSN